LGGGQKARHPSPPRQGIEILESADKPGSVMDDHSSGTPVAGRLVRPTRKRPRAADKCFPIWSCSERGLPCHRCYQQRGALLPHHFTLTSRGWRYIFCGTFRRLAPPRRYLALCPVEPGLSSITEMTAVAWPTPRSSVTFSALSQCERPLVGRVLFRARQLCCDPGRLFQRQLVQQHAKTAIQILITLR